MTDPDQASAGGVTGSVSQRRTRVLLGVGAGVLVLVAGIFVSVQVAGGQEQAAAPSTSATSPTPSPSPIATPSPFVTPMPTPEPTVSAAPASEAFTTPNGTMRMHLPAGTTLEDLRGVDVNHDGREQWSNGFRFELPSGTTLAYSDGYQTDAGAAAHDSGVVAEIPITEEYSAYAWWMHGGGDVFTRVAVARHPEPGAEPISVFWDEGAEVGRAHYLRVYGEGEYGTLPGFATVEEAEAFLERAEIAAALEVMATVELLPVDQYAMP